jgi:hypothetical protein
MSATAEHHDPIGKADTLDTWRKRMRMPVPAAAGHIVDLLIVRLYETTAVNGLPLDLVIEAQETTDGPVKRFGVVFGAEPPDWPSYGIPVLWRRDGEAGVGRWK